MKKVLIALVATLVAVSVSGCVGVGKGKARVWTCDLTHGYIDINADYRS